MDTEGAEQWLPIQVQVLRNDLDVALGAMADCRRRLDRLSDAVSALLAERRGESSAADTDRRLDELLPDR